MKSKRKTIFIVIIIGLIFSMTIMFFFSNYSKPSVVDSQQAKFKLLEIKLPPEDLIDKHYGQVTSRMETEVRMNVSGKIDENNHALKPGSTFNKNDILIKVERLKILYELLTTRSQYKKFIQEVIKDFPLQLTSETGKWNNFRKDIQRTQLLPSLPKVNSKEEEDYLSGTGLYSQYYKIKKLELGAENYIYAAPFDGVIVESKINPGSTIEKNRPLMTISKRNSLIVKANVPINSIHNYTNSKQVYYVDAKLDTLGKGVFENIGSKLSDSSTIECLFNLNNQNPTILNEVVQILLPQKTLNEGFTLPLRAVEDNHVLLYESDKILEISIQVVSTKNDSITVKGLPRHCFVVIPTE